jgi:hypothetical protein
MKLSLSTSTTITPIKGYTNVYYNENPYILSTSVQDFEVVENENKKDAALNVETEGVGTSRTKSDRNVGRIVQYETITVTTPVLTSARLKQAHKACSEEETTKRVLDRDDVDELNEKLQSLLLLQDNCNDTTTTENVRVETDHIRTATSRGKNNTNDTKSSNEIKKWKNTTTTMDLDHCNRTAVSGSTKTTNYYGRCTVTTYNSMTNDFVEVTRSARLA